MIVTTQSARTRMTAAHSACMTQTSNFMAYPPCLFFPCAVSSSGCACRQSP